jgi:hypothetical protein
LSAAVPPQATATFAERLARVRRTKFTQAQLRVGQAMSAVFNSTGLVIELDAAGHAYLAGRLEPDEHPRAARLTRRDVQRAVAFVEAEAADQRCEQLVRRWHAAPIRVSARPRERRARTTRHSRATASATGSSDDGPQQGEDHGGGQGDVPPLQEVQRQVPARTPLTQKCGRHPVTVR